ncbi:MAG: TolC family protein [Bacteroidota bacterium]
MLRLQHHVIAKGKGLSALLRRSSQVRLLVLLALVLSGSVGDARAQVSDTVRLTSDEAVARALTSAPEVIRGRLRIARARAERLRQGAFFPALPELEYARSTDAPFAGAGEGSWLTQEIELGGQSGLRRRASDAAVAQTESEARGIELAARADVRRAFATLVAAEDRLRLADSLLAFAVRLDTIAGRLLSVGEISELDRNALHIERTSEQIERTGAVSALEQARSGLSLLLGLSPATTIIPVRDELLTAPPSVAATLANVSAVQAAIAANHDTILQHRPEWAALERSLERLRAERSLGARQLIPTIRLGLSLQGDRLILGKEDVQGNDVVRNGFDGIDKSDRLLGFRLGMAVPLPFSGLYNTGEGDVAVADAEIAIVEAERTILAANIRNDINQSAIRLRSASDAIQLYQQDISPLIGRNLELLERGYTAGELSATQVLTQQQQLVRIQEVRIRARQEYAEAFADFERAIAQ